MSEILNNIRTLRIINKMKNEFGKIPLCNGKSNRAPQINNFCFPLCWRCMSIIVSVVICCLCNLIKLISYDRISILKLTVIGGSLLIPITFDGLLQYKFMKESTNIKRVITGAMGGLGFWIIANALNSIIKIYIM